MNLTNYYWYFKSAIPERVCDDIIKYGNAQREQIALTGGQTQKLAELEAKEKAKPKKPKKKKIISEATAHLSDEYLESLDPAEKLEKEELNDLRKKKEILILLGSMIVGFIKKFNHMYIKQMLVRVGILIGIFLSLVNLQNIN